MSTPVSPHVHLAYASNKMVAHADSAPMRPVHLPDKMTEDNVKTFGFVED